MLNKTLYQPEFTENDHVSKEDEAIELLLMRAEYFAQVGDHEQSLKCCQNIFQILVERGESRQKVKGIVELWTRLRRN